MHRHTGQRMQLLTENLHNTCATTDTPAPQKDEWGDREMSSAEANCYASNNVITALSAH